MSESESQIVNFFTNKIIFLTGSTGFLGKLVLEKLVRVCYVKLIYVVVRQKKGESEKTRFAEMFNLPLFTRMKKECPDYLAKIHMITGDCALENLGIAEDNWKVLKEQTNVVIHCAATVRFDQELRTAYNINVRASRDLLNAAKEMKNLQSFIHVSTAYSNCTRKDIDEKIYDPPLNYLQLETFLKTFEDDEFVSRLTPQYEDAGLETYMKPVKHMYFGEQYGVDKMSTFDDSRLLGDWPNTYTFTKCLAEDMVARMAQCENNELPVAIVRPSIIISTYKDPIPGWIDNFYGPLGLTIGICRGVLRTCHCVPDYLADLVPADYVVNSILVTAWFTSLKTTKQVEVYNYVSGQYSLNWKSYVAGARYNFKKFPLIKSVWRTTFTLNRWKWKHRLDMFFLHTVPAHIFDFAARVMGRKPRMVEVYRKIHRSIDALSYFTTQEWNFVSEKMDALWKHFNEEDKTLFEIRIRTFDWHSFFTDLVCGIRVYLLHDPLSTVPKARKHYQRLVIAHWTLVSLLVVFIAYIRHFGQSKFSNLKLNKLYY